MLSYSKIWREDFEKIGGKVGIFGTPYVPQNGGDPPKQKLFFLGVPRPVRCTDEIWGMTKIRGLRGAKTKKCHAPKIFEPHFGRVVLEEDFFPLNTYLPMSNTARMQQKKWAKVHR